MMTMGDIAELYDWGDCDMWDDEDGPRETACRDCGSTDVYWAQVKGLWVLYGTNSRKHVCNAKHLSELRRDAFDDLD